MQWKQQVRQVGWSRMALAEAGDGWKSRDISSSSTRDERTNDSSLSNQQTTHLS